MRPKRIRLGYSRICGYARQALSVDRFNEAQAYPPGIFQCDSFVVAVMARSRCFNEAQAYPPGIFQLTYTCGCYLASEASMRPKRIRLGYSPRPAHDERYARASMRPKRVRLGYSPPPQGGRGG